MIEKLADRVHPRAGNPRGLEPPDDLVGGPRRKRVDDERRQGVVMGDAGRVRGETRVTGERRFLQDLPAEADPLAFVLDAEIDHLAVTGCIWPVGSDGGMPGAAAWRRSGAVIREVGRVA